MIQWYTGIQASSIGQPVLVGVISRLDEAIIKGNVGFLLMDICAGYHVERRLQDMKMQDFPGVARPPISFSARID